MRTYPRCLSTVSPLADENLEGDAAWIPQLLDQNFLVADRYVSQAKIEVADA